MRLSVRRLLDEAGLEGVRQTPLYVTLWRSGVEAWRLEHGVRPLAPQVLGSQAVLVALHPEGTEVVFGEDGTNRLSLAVDNAVLIPTSRGYRLVNRGGDPRLLVVVGTHQEVNTRHREPEHCAVAVQEDRAAGMSAGHECEAARNLLRSPQRGSNREKRVQTHACPGATKWT